MTPVLLPLVATLASVGINTAGFTPTDDLRNRKVDLGYLSVQDPLDAPTLDPALGSLIAGSSYPEAYRWTGSGGSAELGKSGGPVSQARVVSGDSDVVEGFDDPDDPSDEEFSWTSGVGMVGIGFRWRFR